MPFYTVICFEQGARKGDFCHDATNRPAAIRIANEHASLKGWNPDKWKVYRNADMNNSNFYIRDDKGGFKVKE